MSSIFAHVVSGNIECSPISSSILMMINEHSLFLWFCVVEGVLVNMYETRFFLYRTPFARLDLVKNIPVAGEKLTTVLQPGC